MATAFAAGATRERNGWIYERQADGQWLPTRRAGSAASGGLPTVIEGPPDVRGAAADRRAEAGDRRAEEAANRAARAEDRAERAEQRAAEAHRAQMARQPGEGSRPLPAGEANTLRETAGVLRSLRQANERFEDDFAGNLVGGIENRLQAWQSWIGTPGQRDWWAAFQRSDIGERNSLFGATLTPSENAAFTATTVSPSMDPLEVERNVSRRAEAARSSLLRQRDFLIANGYRAEAVDALIGDDLLSYAQNAAPTGGDGAGAARAGGPVAFLDEALPPQEGGPTPNQQQYRARLQAALNNGSIRNYEDFQAFARANAAELGLDPEAAARASSPDAVREAVRGVSAGRRIGVVDPARPDAPPSPAAMSISAARGEDTAGERLDAFGRGAADVLSLGLADEIAAAGDTIASGGTFAENLYRQRAIDAYDSENHTLSRFGGQFGAGFLLPTFGASRARTISALGAGYGGAYGFGSGEGGLGDRAANALEGAFIGGAIAAPLAFAGTRLASRARARSAFDDRSELVAAADRQGIDLLPADVGGPLLRRATAGVNQSPIGGAQITRAAERGADQFGDRVAAIAAEEGTPVRQEVLGETVEGAFRRFNENSGQEGADTYARARSMAAGRQFTGDRALAALDENIAALSENSNTNASLIEGLNRLRGDLADGAAPRPKSIDAIRDLRTSVRAEAQTDGLRATDYGRRARQVLDSLSEDIAAQLPPEAAAEFRRADALWAERLDFIDDVETRLLGRAADRSAERVTKSLMEMTRGDSLRFSRILDQVTPEEAGVIRGSVIQEMGRPPAGTPGNFSVETWARNYRSLPDRTRDALFRGENREHAADLLRIAEGIEGTNRYRNTSNTTGAAAVIEVMRMIGSGAAAWGTYGATFGAEVAAGRLLSSPRFARWLARPPKRRSTAITRLADIAAREPNLAPDINVLQARLADSFAQSPAPRAAAEDENP